MRCPLPPAQQLAGELVGWWYRHGRQPCVSHACCHGLLYPKPYTSFKRFCDA